MTRVLAFDTETTGLPVGTRQPFLIQLGMISYTADMPPRMTDERILNELVNPDLEAAVAELAWDEASIEVHGIKPSDVADKTTLSGLAHKIFEVAVGAEVLLGYNLDFDVQVLASELARHDMEHHFPWPLRHVDVMTLAMEALPIVGRSGQKMPKLGEIYEHLFNEPLEGVHDAFADIRATIRVWEALR